MERSTLSRVRAMLAVVLWLTIAGTALELVLVEHDEQTEQVVPFYVLGAISGALILYRLFPRDLFLRLAQLSMIACIGTGIWGLVLHYDSNLEFKREMRPDLEGWELTWETLHAKSPPSLAPGAMVLIGLLGATYAYGRRDENHSPSGAE